MTTPSDTPYRNRLSRRNRLARALWNTAYWLLFRPSPWFLFAWRRALLRCFGARIGRGVHIYASVRIWAPWNLTMADHSCLAAGVDCYNVAPISIGPHATVSQQAFLCTASHDIADPGMALTSRPIALGARSWVAARACIGPGVSIGEGGVAALGSVVVHDVEAWTVVGGNPARAIKRREMRGGGPMSP